MNESEFLDQCDAILAAIEDGLESSGLDHDAERSGHVLTLEFENGSKLIVNGNVPLREMWVAARAGGFHFQRREGRWLDTRSGEELFGQLSRLISQQSGGAVILNSPG